MFLLDTNVISESAPAKQRSSRSVAKWMDEHSDDLYLSVITVIEIEAGIAKATRHGFHAKSDRLTAWLETVLHLYGPRILSLDTRVARIAGGLLDLASGRGHAPGLADIAIAATARHYGLVVLTRNLRHFGILDVPVRDPFRDLP